MLFEFEFAEFALFFHSGFLNLHPYSLFSVVEMSLDRFLDCLSSFLLSHRLFNTLIFQTLLFLIFVLIGFVGCYLLDLLKWECNFWKWLGFVFLHSMTCCLATKEVHLDLYQDPLLSHQKYQFLFYLFGFIILIYLSNQLI